MPDVTVTQVAGPAVTVTATSATTVEVGSITNTTVQATIGAVAGGGIPEAPIDGKQYARQDADWSEVVIPPSSVTSVNGETGVVVLDATDVGADPAGTAAAAIVAHVGLADPHTQYTTAAEAAAAAPVQSVNGKTGAVVLDAADVGADVAGAAATVQGNLNSHTGNTSNPHDTTAAQVGADPTGTAAAAIVAHVGLADPHTQYTTAAEAAAAAPVQSVNSLTGAVVLSAATVGADPAGSAATVQGNLNSHTGLTTTAHGGIVASTDARLTDARTPTAHAASHAPAGSDALPWTTIHGSGPASARPAASSANAGYLYFSTDTLVLERSTGSAWATYSPAGGGGGGDITGLVGRVLLDTGAATATVTHDTIDPLTDFPVVALEVGSAASDLLITGIYDRTATSFKVALSGNPATGSYLCWHLAVPSGLPASVSSALTYNLDGTLATITTSRGTQTFAYNLDGTLASITGTGAYQNKAFTYTLGKLTAVTVT
jgi:hypothetical protein